MTDPPPNDNGNTAAPNINGEDNCDTNSTSTNGEDISFDLSHLTTPTTNSPSTATANILPISQSNVTLNMETDQNTAEAFPDLSEGSKHVQMVLLSRRKENMTLKFRRDLLFSFLWCAKGSLGIRSYFHTSMEKDAILTAWHAKLFQCRVKTHMTNNDFVGRGLFALWMKLKESDNAKKKDTNSRQTRPGNSEPEPVKKLRKLVDTILKRYTFEKASSGTKKPRRIPDSTPKSDPLCHDNFACDNKNWRKNVFPSPCPACDHHSICKFDKDEFIISENLKKRATFIEANLEFTRLGPTKQASSKKPKAPHMVRQRMICMCVLNQCVDYNTGKGCLNCQKTRATGAPLIMDPKTGSPSCPMCSCTCMAFFFRNDWTKLKVQTAIEKKKESNIVENATAASKYISDIFKN